MLGDILGPERRRRWRDEEKLGIVLSIGVGGATVTHVAQRHEVTRQQLYAWRQLVLADGTGYSQARMRAAKRSPAP